jgi:hypothetical protein
VPKLKYIRKALLAVIWHVIILYICRAKKIVESILERMGRLERHRLSCLEYTDTLMGAENGDRVVKDK